jgi:hypothetical protein
VFDVAGSFSLSYGGTTITLSPLSAYQPDLNIDKGTVQHVGLFGKLFTYTNYTKVNDRLEMNNVSKTNADYLNTWALNKYTLTYTRDTDVSATTYQVKIINDGVPFFWMPNTAPDTLFQGSIMLREI